jgi:dimethylaniline monooxygenase (N-oxide forming)
LHSKWGSPIRKSLFGSLGAVIKRQLRLVELNLLPEGGFERIASSTISLSTEGFYDRVKKKEKLFVKRDVRIEKLLPSDESSRNSKGLALLSSGEKVPVDVIVCGTGFHQRAHFLPKDVQDKLTDERGNWIGLHRQILPIGVPDLTFNGYNSSLICATSSEVAALWIAAYLEGDVLSLPSEQEQARGALERFHWLEEKSRGKSAHGTNTVPFSLRPVDDLLLDLQLDISTLSKALQWLLPVSPSAYRFINPQLRKRVAGKRLDKKQKLVNGARG